jgi:hypothetical protein
MEGAACSWRYVPGFGWAKICAAHCVTVTDRQTDRQTDTHRRNHTGMQQAATGTAAAAAHRLLPAALPGVSLRVWEGAADGVQQPKRAAQASRVAEAPVHDVTHREVNDLAAAAAAAAHVSYTVRLMGMR